MEADPVRELIKTLKAFNRFERDIDTVDAEQIMEALFEIGSACGVSEAVFAKRVDSVRDF